MAATGRPVSLIIQGFLDDVADAGLYAGSHGGRLDFMLLLGTLARLGGLGDGAQAGDVDVPPRRGVRTQRPTSAAAVIAV
jgi:hypothetical protein